MSAEPISDDTIEIARCDLCGASGATDVHRCVAKPVPLPAWATVPRPVIGPLPVSDPPRRFDPAAHAWDAARDLERLAAAKWVRHYYGRSVNLEPSVRATGERELAVDKASAYERELVAAIQARLDGLRTGAGRRHAAVLWWVFMDHAPEQRMPAASLVQGRETARAEVGEAFLEELGWRFADKATRKKWKAQPHGLRHSLPREHGRRLYREAVAAWVDASIIPTSPTNPT